MHIRKSVWLRPTGAIDEAKRIKSPDEIQTCAIDKVQAAQTRLHLVNIDVFAGRKLCFVVDEYCKNTSTSIYEQHSILLQ